MVGDSGRYRLGPAHFGPASVEAVVVVLGPVIEPAGQVAESSHESKMVLIQRRMFEISVVPVPTVAASAQAVSSAL